MKKTLILSAAIALTTLVSSCDTYTGMGAYAGAGVGSILGSAIGGLSGGFHGSHIGTIVGMAGGAAVGAAIGSQADDRAERRAERYEQERYDRERYRARSRYERDREEVRRHYERVQENKARGYNPYASYNSAPVYHSDGSYAAPATSPSSAHGDVPTYNARSFSGTTTQSSTHQPVVDETNSGDDRIEF
jgi:hypothetical protein